MRTDDMIITIAYFSIPIQILISLYHYPRLHSMPWYILLLAILFALFVFLCGAGHLLKCLSLTATSAYRVVNTVTAVVSMATALYLLPIIPFLMSTLDQNIQELVKLNEETEDSKRKLMTFMAFLCHEIRNPLFIITSTISFLEGDYEDDEKSSLSLIKQSTNLMLCLVNDVLDISRLESGSIELEKHDFDLLQTLDDASTSARALLRERHGKKEKEDGSGNPIVELRTFVDPEVPHLVYGDQVRILQVCLNLLSNAVKFTETGFVDFKVSVCDYGDALDRGFVFDTISASRDCAKGTAPTEDTGDFSMSLLDDAETGTMNKSKRSVSGIDLTVLQIHVKDTGCGIPADQVDHVFRPYSMAKLAEYRQQGGTGLGLAIVSKLIRIMHGTVQLRSSVGIGSVFEAYIVVEKASLSNSFATDDYKRVPVTSTAISPRASPTPIAEAKASKSDARPCLRLLPSPNLALVSECRASSSPTGQPISPPVCISRTKQKRSMPKFDFPSKEAVVLVVDDNDMNRKLLSRMLKGFNLEYQEARNGQEAVDAMLLSRNHTGNPNDSRIGFILMDLSMPVMSGCEATEIIRRHGLDVPILALTAAAIEEGRDRVMSAGATDYATKPILRDDLYARCALYLSSAAETQKSLPWHHNNLLQ